MMRCCCLLLFMLAVGRLASAQCGWQPGEGVAGVEGTVEVLFPWDPDGPEGPEEELLVVGGAFTAAGTVDTANIAVWRPSDRSWFALGNGLGYAGITAVLSVAATPDGRLFAGGQFRRDVGAPADYVAMWDGTNWTPVGEGLNSSVHALTVTPDGLLIAGGYFSVPSSSGPTAIAGWNGTNWAALDGGPFSGGTFKHVTALAALPDGSIVAAGKYSDDNLEISADLAMWDGDGWASTGYGGGDVYSLSASASADLVVGSDLGGGSQVHVRSSDGQWAPIRVPFEFGRAYAVRYLGDGSLVGCFAPSSVNYPYHIVMKWNGSAWDPIGPVRRRADAYAIAEMSDGRLVIGGNENLLEQWNTDHWAPLGDGFSHDLYAVVARPGGGAYVGGKFRWVHGHNASGAAAWDTDDWQALGDAMNPGGWVYGLVVDTDGDVAATGPFLDEYHAFFEAIGWWDGSAWTKTAIPHPSALAEKLFMYPDGSLGVIAGHVWRLKDGLWSHESAGISSYARVATAWNGNIVLCGAFSYIDELRVNRIARRSGDSWNALGSGVDLPIFAVLAHSSGDLFVGGQFIVAGEIEANRIARWNGEEWLTLGSGIEEYVVYALAELPNGDVVAGGSFTTAGGVAANNIARWDGSQWHALGDGTNGVVRALAVLEDGSLAVGGDFTHVDGRPSAYFARYVFPGSPPEIATQPADATACMVTPASFTVGAIGEVAYQWQIADSSSTSGWLDLEDGGLELGGQIVGRAEGANAHTLHLDSFASSFATEVRCVVSAQCAETESDSALLSVCRADVDCDGRLDVADFFVFFDAYLACDGSPSGCESGGTDPNFNRDSIVDIMDFLEYLDSYGSGCS